MFSPMLELKSSSKSHREKYQPHMRSDSNIIWGSHRSNKIVQLKNLMQILANQPNTANWRPNQFWHRSLEEGKLHKQARSSGVHFQTKQSFEWHIFKRRGSQERYWNPAWSAQWRGPSGCRLVYKRHSDAERVKIHLKSSTLGLWQEWWKPGERTSF